MRKSASGNTLYTNDNLYILSGLNSESVDLIYLDPPFNTKRMYSASVGCKTAGASFKDIWTWEAIITKMTNCSAVRVTKSKATVRWNTCG